MILVDTGPLVAYFDRQDQQHEWALEQFRLHPAPYLTCEAVLTEADRWRKRTAETRL